MNIETNNNDILFEYIETIIVFRPQYHETVYIWEIFITSSFRLSKSIQY